MNPHPISVLPLLASLAAAQVTVDGTVRPVSGSPCGQGETHVLDCTGVYLKSAAVNLATYEGQIVRVLGTNVGTGCVLLDVTQVTSPSGTLTWSGTPVPGCRVDFRICGPGISGYHVFISLAPAYLPVSVYFGTVLIALPPFLLANGAQGWCTDIPFDIPRNPGLVGLTVWLQGVVHTIGPVSPPQATDAICLTVQAGSPCP